MAANPKQLAQATKHLDQETKELQAAEASYNATKHTLDAQVMKYFAENDVAKQKPLVEACTKAIHDCSTSLQALLKAQAEKQTAGAALKKLI
jgi:hypothetical protein